jgi:hypothetical protein
LLRNPEFDPLENDLNFEIFRNDSNHEPLNYLRVPSPCSSSIKASANHKDIRTYPSEASVAAATITRPTTATVTSPARSQEPGWRRFPQTPVSTFLVAQHPLNPSDNTHLHKLTSLSTGCGFTLATGPGRTSPIIGVDVQNPENDPFGAR